jgi:hypothetical protein
LIVLNGPPSLADQCVPESPATPELVMARAIAHRRLSSSSVPSRTQTRTPAHSHGRRAFERPVLHLLQEPKSKDIEAKLDTRYRSRLLHRLNLRAADLAEEQVAYLAQYAWGRPGIQVRQASCEGNPAQEPRQAWSSHS